MGLARTQVTASQADIDAVTAVAREYIESYVAGDAERHARVYHPECAKRRFITDPDSGVTEMIALSPRIMADYAAASGATGDDCPTEVVVDDISEDMASVRIYSCRWVDFAHIVKARGQWGLFHITWHGRGAAAA
jgi:hypothetical protein